MPSTCKRLAAEGLLLLQPRRFADSRGYFVETYSQRDVAAFGIGAEFVQDNEAFSSVRGTLRGLHLQTAPEPQAKLVRVIAGAIFDVAVDVRQNSPTYGKWYGVNLTAAAGEQVFVPVGFAHAYVTLEPDTLVSYKVDGFYNKAAEVGIRWDDPDIGIEWPIPRAELHVSDKDAALPFLRDVATPLRFAA